MVCGGCGVVGFCFLFYGGSLRDHDFVSAGVARCASQVVVWIWSIRVDSCCGALQCDVDSAASLGAQSLVGVCL